MLAKLANMISANIHEAKTRLSQLVKAVEEHNETVFICRDGNPVAELRSLTRRRGNRLKPNPRLKPVAVNYDPAEPLTEDEWPVANR
jgi:antitoxin (DNA-binding transcriptional repressor) of toxin-antitoxin stability system